MTLRNNRAPLLSNIKLYAYFHRNMWIQTGVTVRKRLNGVMTSVTLTFDLWPWPFAWTSLLSLVITLENFMMIWWWEHSQKGVTDRRTDRQTDGKYHSLSCLVAAKNCFNKKTYLWLSIVIDSWWMVSSISIVYSEHHLNSVMWYIPALASWLIHWQHFIMSINEKYDVIRCFMAPSVIYEM